MAIRASGTELFQVHSDCIYGLNAVMNEENLSTAFELAQDGLADKFGDMPDVGDDGSVFRRRI